MKAKEEKEREIKHDKECTVQGRKEERSDKGKGRRNKGKGRKGIMGEEEEGQGRQRGGGKEVGG